MTENELRIPPTVSQVSLSWQLHGTWLDSANCSLKYSELEKWNKNNPQKQITPLPNKEMRISKPFQKKETILAPVSAEGENTTISHSALLSDFVQKEESLYLPDSSNERRSMGVLPSTA